MKIDDIATDLVARNSSYVAALSTTGVPLVTITAPMIFTRQFQEPAGKVSVFIEARPEEIEEFTPTYFISIMPVDIYVFVQGASQSVLREQATNYGSAILNCLKHNPYFMSLTARDDFEGVEGNEGTKACKLSINFCYEESAT